MAPLERNGVIARSAGFPDQGAVDATSKCMERRPRYSFEVSALQSCGSWRGKHAEFARDYDSCITSARNVETGFRKQSTARLILFIRTIHWTVSSCVKMIFFSFQELDFNFRI